jgi:hypothetical protein
VQVGRDNPAELKAQKLARSVTRGVIDRDLKPNGEVGGGASYSACADACAFKSLILSGSSILCLYESVRAQTTVTIALCTSLLYALAHTNCDNYFMLIHACSYSCDHCFVHFTALRVSLRA